MSHLATVSEVRLTRFKTFRDAVLPLEPLTVLIGRNSSGKSNALDGLDVLSRLAWGEDVRGALDGRHRDIGAVRGGLEGCPPHGSDIFELGCTVDTPWGAPAMLDVAVRVRPDVRIISEQLSGRMRDGQPMLLRSLAPEPGGRSVVIQQYADRSESKSYVWLNGDRLFCAVATTGFFSEVVTEGDMVEAAEVLLDALRGVFHLDPVPHLMRQYVPARDAELRRSAENLSAAVGGIARRAPEEFAQLEAALRRIAEHPIEHLRTTRSDLDDVMLVVDEGQGGITPAREMSDGMLRFLAIATALITGRHGVDIYAGPSVKPSLTLVVEELENGLHPSQANLLLDLLHQAVARERTQVLVTTHSPALLSALSGDDHRGVIVCDRESGAGLSRLQRLPEIDGYAAAMAEGRLGDVVARGRLPLRPEERDYSDFDRLMGIG
ncbi:AAA family ATPase [Streptomyces prunicolor]|uniref:AAA family ATPase n=1 Tax=Streptomyces prunicolor TaxID=67348 RepID=UPI00224DCDEC|nr:ATP-binding protein [Streptomyces prunicolor]MCX5237526.1 AAA family ATPase [Streptomyces prunicolor]